MNILLTHSQGRLLGLDLLLVARGHRVLHVPLITMTICKNANTKARAIALLHCDWLLFTSQSAVTAWQVLGLTLQFPKRRAPHIGAVGKKTATALTKAGAQVELISKKGNAVSLAKDFFMVQDVPVCIGLPQGNKALPTLANMLEKQGHKTQKVVIYETSSQPLNIAQTENSDTAFNMIFDIVIAASPSAIKAWQASPLAQKSSQPLWVAIGDTTLKAVLAKGYKGVAAKAPTVEGLLAAVDLIAG